MRLLSLGVWGDLGGYFKFERLCPTMRSHDDSLPRCAPQPASRYFPFSAQHPPTTDSSTCILTPPDTVSWLLYTLRALLMLLVGILFWISFLILKFGAICWSGLRAILVIVLSASSSAVVTVLHGNFSLVRLKGGYQVNFCSILWCTASSHIYLLFLRLQLFAKSMICVLSTAVHLQLFLDSFSQASSTCGLIVSPQNSNLFILFFFLLPSCHGVWDHVWRQWHLSVLPALLPWCSSTDFRSFPYPTSGPSRCSWPAGSSTLYSIGSGLFSGSQAIIPVFLFPWPGLYMSLSFALFLITSPLPWFSFLGLL